MDISWMAAGMVVTEQSKDSKAVHMPENQKYKAFMSRVFRLFPSELFGILDQVNHSRILIC